MEKFHKNRNKIKHLKIRRGFPLFINFCYNQKIRNKLNNAKLFIENGCLHYHLKEESGFVDNNNNGAIVKETVQYVIKSISNYSLEKNSITIEGTIEKTKNGFNNKKTLIDKILLYRIYTDEEKLLAFLECKKLISIDNSNK